MSDTKLSLIPVIDNAKGSKRSAEEDTVLSHFANNLRKFRTERGYSQEEMAHLSGFSRSYYNEIETGRRNISLLNLYKILGTLKIEASDLVELPETKQ